MMRRRWMRPYLLVCAGLAGCGIGDSAPHAPGADVAAPDAQPPQPQMDDATYLYRLSLMRGHLFVGNALFERGEHAAAGTHSKHPADELYAPMAIEFAARGGTGFAAELEAHAGAVNGRREGDVEARYAALVAAIAENERTVGASSELAAEVIVRLVREAGEEYAVGIVDGRPANAHEYQDAYGFTRVAGLWAHRAAAADPAGKPVFDRIAEKIDGLADMWPALMPPPDVPHTAARLYGAAADIEILALDLHRRGSSEQELP